MRKIFYMNTSYDEKIDILKDITFEFRPNISSKINCDIELLSRNYYFLLYINLFNLINIDIRISTKELDHSGFHYDFNLLGLCLNGCYCSGKHAEDN